MSVGPAAFTLFDVALSLIGISTGFVALYGFVTAWRAPGWTAAFFITTVATSLTGFLLPFHRLLPSYVLGILSLLALGFAFYALYIRRLQGRWRGTYVVGAVSAQYFNSLVLVAHRFMTVPALKALAPTQTEATCKAAQLCVLVFFLFLEIVSAKRFAGAVTGA